ncbi:MAG: hypothetical protein WC457_04985 [Patescibacteria group bacterium]
MIKEFLLVVLFIAAAACLPVGEPLAVFASTSDGTIDENYKYVWGENLGWINFACENCNVHVTDSVITGYAWSRQYGWIDLSPTNAGVTNDGAGNLGGYAWSGALGWINFSGVVIDASGKFTGIAGTTDTNVGQINFGCVYCDVRTDWRPVSTRGSSGGSSGTIYWPATSSVVVSSPETNVSSLVNSPGYLNWFRNVVKRADIIRDGVIDILDFNILMVHWNWKNLDDPADINEDGEVSLYDFNLLMVYWGQNYSL